MEQLKPVSIQDVRAARKRISGFHLRTPLVRLNIDDAPAEIFLKLENLQPIGSFKMRGAGNAIAQAKSGLLEKGVWTTSAGNMAQGVAWHARRIGVECKIVVPDHAPETKLSAIKRLGAEIVKVPPLTWFHTMRTREFEGMEGLFIHPFSDPAVMAGNGTIGLEILDDLPDVDAITIPYGGGGLSCGIASAVRALKTDVKLYASEVETAAPLAASLKAGEPVEVEYIPSFVDGIGAPYVFPEMWQLARILLDGSIVVGLDEIAQTVRLLAEHNRVITEGAGAASVAAALTGKAEGEKIVCVISGGNIDMSKLIGIFQGKIP
jgi:threonine dehydratase